MRKLVTNTFLILFNSNAVQLLEDIQVFSELRVKPKRSNIIDCSYHKKIEAIFILGSFKIISFEVQSTALVKL